MAIYWKFNNSFQTIFSSIPFHVCEKTSFHGYAVHWSLYLNDEIHDSWIRGLVPLTECTYSKKHITFWTIFYSEKIAKSMVTGSGVEAQWWGRYSRIVKMYWFNIFFCIIKVKEVVHCYCAPNVQMSNCEFTAKSMGQRLKFCVGLGRERPKGGGGGYRIWSYIEHAFFT